jgi:predicted Zn-dependent protease
MRERDEIKVLLDSALSCVEAPQAQVQYYHSYSLAARFAENAITQNIGGEEEHVRIVVAYGKRHGSSITNRPDDESIKNLVARAEDIARNSPEDPEYMPPVEPQSYPDVPQRYYENVSRLTPRDIADKISNVVSLAQAAGYRGSGLFQASHGSGAVANTTGLFAFDRFSNLDYSTTIHGQKGSGFSSEAGESAETTDAAALAQRALETARASQNPEPVESGDYVVIFEPQAVLDLLSLLVWNLSARDADEGTTVFAGKVGEKLFSEKVSVATKIDDPDLPAPPYGEDGLAAENTVWIKNGVVERLRYDRYWAKQKGTKPDPLMLPLFMEGQDRSVEDLVAGCETGLLVKRLWYIRYVDRKELLLTGMTRDGLFLIEDGKIVRPVQNLRFNESPIVFLQNILSMSRPVRVGSWAKLPGIMSDNFTFSSTTESV